MPEERYKKTDNPISIDANQEDGKTDNSQEKIKRNENLRTTRLELSDPKMRQAVKYIIANKFIIAGLSKANIDVTSERSMLMLSESFLRRGEYEKSEKYGAQCLKRLGEKGEAYKSALRPLEELQLFLTMVKNAESIGSDTESVRKVLKECENAIEQENLEEYFKKIDKAEKEMKKELKKSLPIFKNVIRTQLEEARIRKLDFKVRDDIFKELDNAFAKEEYMIALVHAINCIEEINKARDDYALSIVEEAKKKLESVKSAGENVADAERAFKYAADWLAELERKRTKAQTHDASGWKIEEMSLLETATITSETITSENIGIVLVSQKGVKCAVCQGAIKPRFPLTKCDCGKTFHDTCGIRVENCPYCGASVATPQNKKIETVINSARLTIRILDSLKRKNKGEDAFLAENALEDAEKELARLFAKYSQLTNNETKIDLEKDLQFILFQPYENEKSNSTQSVVSPSLINSILTDARQALNSNDFENAKYFAENAKRMIQGMYPSIYKLAAKYWERKGIELMLPQVELAILKNTVQQGIEYADSEDLSRSEEVICAACELLTNHRLQIISNNLAMYQLKIVKLEKLGANMTDAKEVLGLGKAALQIKNIKSAEETINTLENMLNTDLANTTQEKYEKIANAIDAARKLGIQLQFESEEVEKIEGYLEKKQYLKSLEGLNALEESLNRKLQWEVPRLISALRAKVENLTRGDITEIENELDKSEKSSANLSFIDALEHADNASILIEDANYESYENFNTSQPKEAKDESKSGVDVKVKEKIEKIELAKLLDVKLNFRPEKNAHKLDSLLTKAILKEVQDKKNTIAELETYGVNTESAKRIIRETKTFISKGDFRGAYDNLAKIDSELEKSRKERVLDMFGEVEEKIAKIGDISLLNSVKDALENGEIGVAMLKLKDIQDAISKKEKEFALRISKIEELLSSFSLIGINTEESVKSLLNAKQAYESENVEDATRIVDGITFWCEGVVNSQIESINEIIENMKRSGEDVRLLEQMLIDAKDTFSKKEYLRALQFTIQIRIELENLKRT